MRDVKQLYTRWDIDYFEGTSDLRMNPDFLHFETPEDPTHSSDVVNAPFWDSEETVVYVHGWNNSDDPMADDKASGAETMLKRLYWQGFRGEFVAFNWPTFTDREAELNFYGLQESIEWLALSYNPSDFQAYRSANALREILESYRGEFPDLRPVHLLAHSMGNIVAGEALRLWAADPETEDPLVTNYVAMEGAVSSGAWRNNGTDSRYLGRPVPDLYRFWSHGRDGFSDPSLGLTPYFSSAGFSAEHIVNMYNASDYALGWWDYNNISKELFFTGEFAGMQPSAVWEFGYEFEPGDGENTNNDTFLRIDPAVNPPGETMLTLTESNGSPGPNAYEILAFFSMSASLPIGTKSVTAFDTNIDVEAYGMLHGSDLLVNHSYQFAHDAAETWQFFNDLIGATGILSTHGSLAPGGGALSSSAAIIEKPSKRDENLNSVPETWSRGVVRSSKIVSEHAVAVPTWATDELLWLTRRYRPVASIDYDTVDATFAAWKEGEHDDVKLVGKFDLLAESLIN